MAGTDAPKEAAARRNAAAALPNGIAFLGLGLIGGSVALALREAGYRGRLVAWTPSGRGPGEARRRGIIDEAAASAEAAIDGAGLVVLAGPPLAVLESVSSLGAGLRKRLDDGATITDVASTKVAVLGRADASALPFVGGHPMAGRESTGVGASVANLFEDRPWVVVPGAAARPSDVDRVEALATACGATTVRLAAEEHDAAVAAVSHLPLVLSASLVEAVAIAPGAAATWPLARELAATGWRDMSRLAKGDPEMGAGILVTNAEAVAAHLHALRDAIDAWLEQLEPEAGTAVDAERLRRRLEAARAALEAPPK